MQSLDFWYKKMMKNLKIFICLLYLPLTCYGQTSEVQQVASLDGTALKTIIFHPAGAQPDKPRPVVIALHGCGGLYSSSTDKAEKLNARHAGMAQLITDKGYTIVFPDSFTSRGETSLCTQIMSLRNIKQSHRADDVDGVLLWLSKQPWADSSKIALLGWSHGGSTVLRSTDKNRQNVNSRITQPSIAIAFYPGCSDAVQNNYQPQTPLVMMLAELDDWTPPGPCIQLANQTNSKAYVYPESYHDFDNPIGNVRIRTDVPNGVNPGKGVHVGRNPLTGPMAWEQLLIELQKQWR